MTFSIEGLLTSNSNKDGSASGVIAVEESAIKPLYEYLKNGEPQDSSILECRAIPLALRAYKHVAENGFVYLRLAVEPHSKYRKKDVHLSAEALAAAFNGEILSDALPLFCTDL